MVVHHIVTLTLITMSYLMGFQRIGMIVIFLHDCSDPFMEIAKCALYTGYLKVANVAFAGFASVFYYSRLWLYPQRVILPLM